MLIVFCIFLSAINFYFLVKILSEKPYQKDIQDFQTQTERLMVEFNRITTRNIDLLDSRIEELNHKIRQSQKTEALLKELFEEAQKIEHLSSIIPNRHSPDSKPSLVSIETSLDSETPPNNIVEAKKDENQRSRHSSVRQLPVSNTTDNTVDTIDDKPSLVSIEDSLDSEISTQNRESTPIVDEYINDNPSLEELYSIKPSPVSTNTTDTTGDTSIKVEDSENQRSWADSLFEGISVNKIKKHRKKVKNSQELLKKYIQENKPKEELLEMGYNINEINLVSLLEKNTK